jgi:integrase
MPQKHKKKPQELQVCRPVFTSAKNLKVTASTPAQVDPIPQNTSNPTSSLKEKLDFYRQKAKVPNTEKSTRNWIIQFEEFRKEYKYIIPLEQITDSKLIEKQVCEYIAQMSKKNNSGEYKAKSIKQAVDAINRYLVKISPIHRINLHDKYEFPDLWTVLNGKMKYLQENGFGEKEGSMALSAQQVQEILADEFLNPSTPEGLLYRVFFRIAINFACRGGEHYGLHVDQFHSPPDGSLIFRRYRSKNNQRGIEGGSAQDIHLPLGSEAITDINKYLSKRPSGAPENFYLQVNPLWRESGIWYKKTHCGVNRVGNFMKDIGKSVKVDLPPGILTNHSGRKTVAQILQDADVPEDAIMGVTGHKSVQGIRAYKEVNEKQHLAAMNTLIHAIEPSRSSILGDSTNTNIADTPVEFSFDDDKKFPIFNNCHFNNVTFKL